MTTNQISRRGRREGGATVAWPLMIHDTAEVIAVDPGRKPVLATPAGSARVQIELTARSEGTIGMLTEYATAGPGRLLPRAAQHLLGRLDHIARNREG